MMNARFGVLARACKALLAVGLGALAFFTAPRQAHAVYKFCATIQPVYQDSGVGEDHLVSGTVPAKNHYMEIRRNDVLLASGWADAAGCVTIPFSAAGTYKHAVYPRMRWVTGATQTTLDVYTKPGASLSGWSLNWGALPADTGAAVVTKTKNLSGTALDGLFRVTAVAARSPFIVSNTAWVVYAQIPAAEADCTGCAGDTDIYLSQEGGVWLNQKKGVIAHEWGHLMQAGLFGYFGMQGVSAANIYCASVSESTCRCDNVAASPVSTDCGGEQWDRLHCLNSREYMFGAFQEGFAHTIATTILNNTAETTATFPYYKVQIADTGTFVWLPPVHHQVLPTTRYRWMETECNSTMAGRGTEMDWLGFLYYVTSQTTNKYTWQELQNVMTNAAVCNGLCSDAHKMTYARMVLGVDAQPWTAAKKNHFKNNGTPFGVNH